MERTEGFLLGGRIRYAQPRAGFRSGIEPVLLAAAVPARSGEHVLEGGSGAGAGLLCLAERVPGIVGLGVEQDADLATLARDNARANGRQTLHFITGVVEAIPQEGLFDHAFANPPYHPSTAPPSPDPGRDSAKRGTADVLATWSACLAARLRPRGTLTIAAPASRLAECLAALTAAQCGSVALLPLWPGPDRPAKLLLLRGVRAGRGPCRVLAGLLLHTDAGALTEAAQEVLRGAASLPF